MATMNHYSSFNLFFILISLLCGALIGTYGVFMAQAGVNNFNGNNNNTGNGLRFLILGCFFVGFGLTTIVLELFMPAQCLSFFGFYGRWLGKGLWFLFFGLVIFNPNPTYSTGFEVWAAIILFVVACLYFIFHFLPNMGTPAPVRGHGSIYDGSGGGGGGGGGGAPTRTVKTTTTKSSSGPSNKTATKTTTTTTTSSGGGGGFGFCGSCGRAKESAADTFCGGCGSKL